MALYQTRLSLSSALLHAPTRPVGVTRPATLLQSPVLKVTTTRRLGRAVSRRAASLRTQAALVRSTVSNIETQRLSGCVQARELQVEKLTADELQVAINERDRPLVIDFYATWCGPCLLLAKELEQVAEELGDSVRIVKVDTDENQELSNQLRIEGLPTMVFVGTDPTKPAIRTEGLLPAGTIKDIIRDELSTTPAVS